MNIIHVLFLWSPDKKLKTMLQTRLGVIPNLKFWFPTDSQEKKDMDKFCEQHATKAHIMIGWQPKKEWLWAAKNLQLFINPGTGIHHLLPMMKELNQERPVMLINGHGHAHLTAQHAVALLLSLSNQIVQHHQWMAEGIWRTGDENSPSMSIYKRKIGLLGYGAINQNVHQLLTPFGVEFSILKRNWKKQHPENDALQNVNKFTSEELHDFLQHIDTLIIALPHTSKTESMIGEAELKLLGERGLLVNVARGIIVQEKALFEVLQSKTIAGAAIDVWYNYKPNPDEQGRKYPYQFPFHELDNIVLSPHRAGSPFSETARWDELVNNVLSFAAGEQKLKNVVDLELEY
ncbi:MAG: NAD(P)-dependent oxidoreductase [Chitinophagales bacterium]